MSQNTAVPILHIVLPCYNEEEALPHSIDRLLALLKEWIASELVSAKSRIVMVNDGSRDRTWEIIQSLWLSEPLCSGLDLSRNSGQQNAILAGLFSSAPLADCIVTIDADLQDDPGVIADMVRAFRGGAEIVYGVRSKRETDTSFKRGTAHAFYRVMKSLGAETVEDHAEFRLMSRRAVNALAEFKEVNLFLRGLIPMLGFKTEIVYYERTPRLAGESKYPFKKMLALAWNAITGLSIRPIRLITVLGFSISLVSLGVLIYILIRHTAGHTTTGWSSTTISVWFIGGLILLALGIIGEYIGKIYLETKARPRYFVETILPPNASLDERRDWQTRREQIPFPGFKPESK
ncbi:MAG: glycosyltransferase family 2 protein [Clostridiaceae bacterium]|nr:glycosyltransferase family 2 protein [Clostridiaceae bacterium]